MAMATIFVQHSKANCHVTNEQMCTYNKVQQYIYTSN